MDVRRTKAKAMADLFGTRMEAHEVAGLLGVSERELKAFRAAGGRHGEKANGGEGQAHRTDGAGAGEGQEPRLAS